MTRFYSLRNLFIRSEQTNKNKFIPPTDTFVIESMVNTNELLSDLTPNAHIGLERNADMIQDPFEVHSAYVAIGTLAVAICIVVIVVSSSILFSCLLSFLLGLSVLYLWSMFIFCNHTFCI